MAKTKLDNSVDTIAGECIAVRMRMLNRVVTNLYDESSPVQRNHLVGTGRNRREFVTRLRRVIKFLPNEDVTSRFRFFYVIPQSAVKVPLIALLSLLQFRSGGFHHHI